MAITVSLANLIDAYDALGQLTRLSFQAKLAYRIAKCYNKVTQELRDFEVARMQLFEKYGTRVEGENETFRLDIPREKRGEFENELNELLKEEIELNGIEKINIALFENVSIQPETLVHLGWLLDDTE